MIEVACPKCGASQSIHAASVPPGGKLLKCSACNRLVRITKAVAEAALAAKQGATLQPEAPADLPAPKRPGGDSNADLPAPVGARARSGARAPSAVPANLPAPVSARGRPGSRAPSAIPTNLPAPVGARARDVVDLPAPVRSGKTRAPSALPVNLPAPVGARGREVTDLPAPVGAQGRGVSDLPAPVGAQGRGVSDLPAPVGARGRHASSHRVSDTSTNPATATTFAATSDEVIDLLTPLGADQIADRPVAKAKPLAPMAADSDLAPRGFFDDLPMPVGGSPPGPSAGQSGGQSAGRYERQPAEQSGRQPGGHSGGQPGGEPGDLAPRGFFDDLPMPVIDGAGGPGDGLAPSGFFDDIPMPGADPSDAGLLAPKEDFGLGMAGNSGNYAAVRPDEVGLGGPVGLDIELGASGTTADHAAHDVRDVPELELGSSGSSAAIEIPAATGPAAPIAVGLTEDLEPGIGLEPAPGMGLELDPAPNLGLELDAIPGMSLELDGPADNALSLDHVAMPRTDDEQVPAVGLALDVPEISEPDASEDDGLVDFSAAFESGLRISETDFSSYTNPGHGQSGIADLTPESDAPLGGLDLDMDPLDSPLEGSADAFADLALDPIGDPGSVGLELGDPLGIALDEPTASVGVDQAPAGAADMALELGFDLSSSPSPAGAAAAVDLPSISIPEPASSLALDAGPDLPSIALPGDPANKSISLAAGLDFDLPDPTGDDDAAKPLLEIGLPEPGLELGSSGSGPSQPRADSELELPMDLAGGSAGGATARAQKAADLERALDKSGDAEDAPSLALDADIVAEVESKRRAVSEAGLAVPAEDEEDEAEPMPTSSGSRRLVMIAAAVVLVGALGAGGFFGYKYFKGKKDREAAVQQELTVALRHLRSGTPGHWELAGQAAERGLTHDKKHGEALGIAAQAYLAAYLDTGTDGPRRVQKGRQLIGAINQHSASGSQVDKARALLEIIEYRAARAIPLLESAMRGSSAPDPDALLYLGWALYDSNKPTQAEQRFTEALRASPGRPTPAMYGLGLAQLRLGKRKNALNNFEAVLENQPDHLGAHIARAQAVDVEQFSERERMFLDIVKRDNLDKASPKLVAKAWSLAGNQALEAGRLPDAKERFEKALEASKRSVEANLGLAKVALGQGELATVRKPLEDILKNQPDHLEAKLILAELSVKEGDMKAAETHVKKLLEGEKKLENKLDRARIHTLNGQLLTARADQEPALPKPDQDALLAQAIEAYQKARELAGESDVRIAVALAELLSRTERAEEAGTILTPIKAQAKSDASLSVLLGLVYAKAKDPVEAETWFRSALALNPNDTESRFQLGLALDAQGRVDEALSELEAAFNADKKRTDIGAELASIYESKNRDDDARVLYEELLRAEDRTVVLLMRAGLFFARTGSPDKAKKLAEGILASESNNPVGLYIMGESLFGDGDYKNALRRFRDAVGIEQNPRYLEALGRAAEELNFEEEALRSFKEASRLDPDMVIARIGEARVLIRSRSYDKAGEVLQEVLKRWPKSADAYHYIGVIARRNDDLKEAVDNFERALRYDRQRAESYYELGQAYYDLDRQRRAARALTSATKLARPDAPWLTKAYLNLGYAERSRDNRRAAINAWESYLQQNPKDQTQVREIKKLLMRLKAR